MTLSMLYFKIKHAEKKTAESRPQKGKIAGTLRSEALNQGRFLIGLNPVMTLTASDYGLFSRSSNRSTERWGGH